MKCLEALQVTHQIIPRSRVIHFKLFTLFKLLCLNKLLLSCVISSEVALLGKLKLWATLKIPTGL